MKENMIKLHKKLSKDVRPIDIYLIISIMITGIFLLVNWLKGGEVYTECVLSAYGEFADYFMHLAASSDRNNLYSLSEAFCFPPLAYVMYFLLWKINPQGGEDILEWKDYKIADNALHVFNAYNFILIILLIFIIGTYFKKSTMKYMLWLPIMLIFSYPFYCTSLQRGNSVALVAILISLAWLWMDSDSKLEQEMAMILIAVAAGFKFYPAIMGVAYVVKKDWKRVIRLVVYGVIAVFVPFCFFGGIEGLQNLLNTLLGLGTSDVMYRYGTVRGIVETYASLYFGINVESAQNIGIICENLFLLLAIICFAMCRKKWQKCLFISGILASYVSSSWMYTCVYYLPALLTFFQENDRSMKENGIKTNIWLGINIVLYSCIFSIPFFFNTIFDGGIYEGVFVHTYILLVLNMIKVVSDFITGCLYKRRMIDAN